MIGGLEGFVRALRGAGLAVSPAEWLDALRAVRCVGLGQRGRFKAALGCTLAKGPRQREVFERVFAEYFVGPASGKGEAGRRRRGAAIRGDGGTARRNPSGPGDRPAEPPPKDRPRPIERLLEAAHAASPSRGTRLGKVLLRPSEATERRPSPHRPSRPGPADIERRDLTRRLTFDDEAQAASAAERLVQGLRLRASRRLRRRPTGRLYLRQLFRSNVRHGGVPFVLPRRRRRRAPARVVLLIDVSWSTARAAGLFLTMAAGFLRRAGRTRVLLFVDRAVDAGGAIGRFWEDAPGPAPGRRPRAPGPGAAIVRGARSFADVVGALPGLNLQAPSDYGRALHGLAGSPSAPRGRDTVLLVLGDGRCNRFDPQAWAFEELAERCGAVVWLVPEAAERWGTGDSALGAYLPHADVAVEARDLQGLARGLGALVRRL